MLCMLTLPSSFFIILDVDKKHYGHVYEIINLINDETYVGQHKIPTTSRNEKWRAYMGSDTG